MLEDISNGDNRNFFIPLEQDVIAKEKDLQDPNKLLLYDYIKTFISSMSCGYVHIDVSCIILDALLTKRFLEKNDPYLIKALAVIVFLLKDEGVLEAKSLLDVFKTIEKKGKQVHEYEFFKTFKSLFKHPDDPDQTINQD